MPDKGSEARPFEGLEGRIEELLGILGRSPDIPEDLDSNHRPFKNRHKDWDI
jgi:hypothetical protein